MSAEKRARELLAAEYEKRKESVTRQSFARHLRAGDVAGFEEELSAIQAALTPQWAEISTAPRDGTPVLAISDHMIGINGAPVMWVAFWSEASGRFVSSWDGSPLYAATHFIAVPAPPEGE